MAFQGGAFCRWERIHFNSMPLLLFRYTELLSLLILVALSTVQADVDTIVISGSKFSNSNNGSQFLVRGIAYQYLGKISSALVDTLADDMTCRRDIPYLSELGINTLYIDAYNSHADHSVCMKLLQDTGIYVIIVLNGRSDADYRVNGARFFPGDYTAVDYMFRVVDFFQNYSNTLGFAFTLGDANMSRLKDIPFWKSMIRETKDVKGAELGSIASCLLGGQRWGRRKRMRASTSGGGGARAWSRDQAALPGSAPASKWVQPITKEHIRSKGYRAIPIGVSGFEHVKQMSVRQYMACGAPEIAADFWRLNPGGINPAEEYGFWCLNSSSSYENLIEQYRNYPGPVLLPHGCDKNTSHLFEEVVEIYSPPMTDVFSGAIFYEWFDNPDELGLDMGLIQINPGGSNISLRPAYLVLSSRLASVKPIPIQIGEYVPTNSELPCEDVYLRKGIDSIANFSRDIFVNKTLPSTPLARLCSCMMQTVNCVANPNATIESLQMRTDEIRKSCHNTKEDESYCYGTIKKSALGRYDSYAACNVTERASWTFHQSYVSKDNDSAACSTLGGLIRQPTPPASLDHDCQTLLRQAGPSGTGTITFIPPIATNSISRGLERSNSLSIGAKTGIGISIGVFFLTLLAIVGFYLRAKKKAALQTGPKSPSDGEYQKLELPNNAIPRPEPSKIILDGSEIIELEGRVNPQIEQIDGDERYEVVGDDGVAELPTPYNAFVELESSPKRRRGSKVL